MGAFKGAVDVGAHGIETDVHITKDGVVVLSHDADLKRCFGIKEKIIDCEWSYIKTLRTLRAPHLPMPRLKDILEYLSSPGLEHIWLLLDIKIDNDADDVMRLIASTIAEVKPSSPWEGRVVLGCWAAKYLPLCEKYLSGFPVTHIGFSIPYARQFLAVPNVSFNMLQKIMIGPFGDKFLRDCKTAKRAMYLWTVNEVQWMKWSIQKQVDGVITDDPKLFLSVCKEFDHQAPVYRMSVKEYSTVAWINCLAFFFGLLFKYRYGSRLDYGRFGTEKQSSGHLRIPA